ncbi:glutamate racemase [Ktedonosporobacter rubrisoli]|uniref:Glutamate racemase n=1 Tax=Ktedonosporobacter rubrisoli TaxID=2509675 RepID=A0A4P6JMJ1_KTERU|nr:glutamate racemase [Ktedonosporobacter rubrisoli]QBD76488.1 glutamate racemase [Ktedonosporobacter rubrisoli]
MNTSAPIGVFDSGMGGLSVLREIRALLPHEHLFYIADSGHAPYGDKTLEYVQQRALLLTSFLLEQGIKLLVIASNTTTAASAEVLRANFSVPIVAMEPAIKPAVAATKTGVIGILVTVATSESTRFSSLLKRFGQDVRLVTQTAPGLVEQIENGDLDGPQTRALVKKYTTPLLAAGADTIVLGSTHYPHLRPLLTDVVGPAITLIDTGRAVARQVQHILDTHGLANLTSEPGRERFWTSGDLALSQRVIMRLWGQAIDLQSLPAAYS